MTTCYRHPKVESYVSCTRCERFICPDCMREASVGHQCPECVKEGARSVRQARTVVGGRVSAVPLVTYVLIGLNVLAYVAELVDENVVNRFGMLGTVPPGYLQEGVAHGEWYRLLTGRPVSQGTFGILHIVLTSPQPKQGLQPSRIELSASSTAADPN